MLSSLSCCFPFRRQPARQNAAPIANIQAATSGDQVTLTQTPIDPDTQYHLNQQLIRAIKDMDTLGIKAVQGAIRRGAKVQGNNYFLVPPLHQAARYGRPEAIEVLFENGADINLPNNDGETPLYRAVHYHQPKAIKTLLKHGANTALLPEEFKQSKRPILEAAYKKLHVDKLIQKEKARLDVQKLAPQQLNTLKRQVSQAVEITQAFTQAGIELNEERLRAFQKQFNKALAYTNWQLSKNPDLPRMEKIGILARIRPILRSSVPLKDDQLARLAEQAHNVKYMEALADTERAITTDYGPFGIVLAKLQQTAPQTPSDNVNNEEQVESPVTEA